MKKIAALVVSLAALALLPVLSASADDATPDVSRVTSVAKVNGAVTVQGQAPTDQGEDVRSLWFQTITGLAAASRAGATGEVVIVRKALNGSSLLSEEKDSLDAGGLTPDAPITRTENDITASVSSRLGKVGVDLVDVNFLRLFAGIAEIVVRPDNVDEFVSEHQLRIATLLGELSDRSYLVTVQDASGANLIIHANVLTRGGGGLGTAWADPSLGDVTGRGVGKIVG